MHDLRVDDRVLITGPFGDAVATGRHESKLPPTAGIGITPALAILDALAHEPSGRRVDLVHAVRTAADLVHWSEVEKAISALPHARSHLFVTGADNAAAGSTRGGRAGACGSCACPVTGDVDYVLDPIAEPRPGDVLLCCAVPASNLTVTLDRDR